MKRSLFLLIFLCACSDDKTDPIAQMDAGADLAGDQSTADTGTDSTADMEVVDPNDPGLNLTPAQAGVSEDGAAVATLETSGARVGRILTNETGFHGLWAHCRNGDFRLYNEKVEVCIQAESTNRNEMFSGGSIVDLHMRGDTSEDVFDLLKPRTGFNVQFASSVKVVRDGTDGGPAVLRVTGYDSPVAYILGIVGGTIFKTDGLDFTTEYRLWPESTEVEIVSWLHNPLEVSKNITPGEWLAPGDRTEPFRDKYGASATNLRYGWISSVGEQSSTSWYGESPMAIDELPFSDVNPWLLTKFEPRPLPPKETYAWRRWLGIGDGSLLSTQYARQQRFQGTQPTPRKIIVKDAAGVPQAGRRVHLESKGDGAALAFGITDQNGELLSAWNQAASLTVEPIPGFEPTTMMVDGAPGGGDVTVDVPTSARLRVLVQEGGQPGHALVRVRATGVESEFFAPHGSGEMLLAPGTYTVQVTRGLEYDLIEETVEVTEGGTDLNVELVRSVDTAGWIAADFHQHMEPSSDSAIYIRNRVIDNVCEGIEFVAPTDHDVVTDLQPYIDELGFTQDLNSFAGLEVSPRTGHVGVYPMPYDTQKRGNGTIALAYMDGAQAKYRPIPEIFAAARALPTNPVVQLNHPRGGTSLFDNTGYDPAVDDPRTFTKNDWSTDFDTMEIINRFNSTCATFGDLASFLNVGLKKTGLGNSDSHTLNGNPAGVPRNYLKIDSAPGQIDGAAVTAAMKAGQITVGAHAFIDFSDAMLPGDTVTGVDHTFNVRVQTPSYSQATRLHVIVNGQIVQTLDRSGDNGNDFDEAITLNFTKDSWVVFFAVGPRANAWEYGDATLAFTNPVYIDIDGAGWTPPGMQTLMLEALNETGFCN